MIVIKTTTTIWESSRDARTRATAETGSHKLPYRTRLLCELVDDGFVQLWRRDLIHQPLLDVRSETADATESEQNPPYATPSGI